MHHSSLVGLPPTLIGMWTLMTTNDDDFQVVTLNSTF